MQSRRPFSSHQEETEAFQEITKALTVDMAFLMHGSGDVVPADVNPESAHLVAQLTAQYISRLVDAAVDSHDLLTDGAGGLSAIPAFASNPGAVRVENNQRLKRKPIVLGTENKRQKLARHEYWDQPQLEPKILRTSSRSASKNKSSSSSMQASALSNNPPERRTIIAKDEEWMGVAGVDLFEESRTRRAYVSTPSVIGPRNFIFPICHDSQLLGRVMELQAARREIAPLLTDAALLELVRTEGAKLKKHGKKKKTKAATAKGGSGNQNEDDNDDDDDDDAQLRDAEAVWPSLGNLLPV